MNREEKEQIKKQYFKLVKNQGNPLQAYGTFLALNEKQMALNAFALEHDLNPNDLFLAVENTQYSDKYSNDKQIPLIVIEYHNLLNTLSELRFLAQEQSHIYADDLLKIHFNIYKRTRYNLAGKFRKSDNSHSNAGSSRSHYTILEEQCSQHLRWLSDRLQLFDKASSTNFFEIFYVATEIHLRLRHADPFECGSTVLAVLMYNYVHYYTSLLPNIIYFEDRQIYRDCLTKSNMSDFTDLINFFLYSFDKTIKVAKTMVI